MKTKENGMFEFLSFSTEVRNAMEQKQPVLAIESTVITHGLPYPTNIEAALELNRCAKEKGVTPAIIAIIDGMIKIGLTHDDINKLATTRTYKASCRDLSYVISQKQSAGTTVALTAMIAARIGLKVFATGGIGGVHRGEMFDVSADLPAVSKYPLTIISSGPKAVLDLPKTMEVLETLSIPIIGFQTTCMPLFYSRKSPFPLACHFDSLENLANYIKIQTKLQLDTAVLVMNPIPEENEISHEIIEPFILQALDKAALFKITGKNVTPFLLEELNQLTKGDSVKANIALLKNNIMLGAELLNSLNNEVETNASAAGF